MDICTASGDTARKPRSRQSLYWRMNSSVLPSASPIDTSSRVVSISGDPAWAQSRRPSNVDICCMYDSRRFSTRFSCSSKVSTSCPPMSTGDSKSPMNGLSSTRMPLWPSSNCCQVSSASGARGVVDATAVTTTSSNPSPVVSAAMIGAPRKVRSRADYLAVPLIRLGGSGAQGRLLARGRLRNGFGRWCVTAAN